MKIAVAWEHGQVFAHFGRSERFKIYEVADGAVINTAVVETGGDGHGALAGFLKEQEVEVLICGGIGGGAQNALSQAGIRLFGGVTGDADAAVADWLAGNLRFNPNVQCGHHGGQGHACSHS